jgi:predicted metal-dependent phosphoesterase TrpH
MGLADLHIHSVHSWDGTATVAAVLKTAAARGMHVVAITDHDDLTGAIEAQALAPRYGLEVVPGVEVSTRVGHVLALYVREPIPAGRSLGETLVRIGAAGGLAVAAHPGAWGMKSLSPALIGLARREARLARVLVGVETLNGSLISRQRSHLVAQPLAQALSLAPVGCSDAHSVALIGSGLTRFEGWTAADLRQQLELGTTQVVAGQCADPLSIITDWLARYSLRRAGWVTASRGFNQPVHLRRLPRRLSAAR